MNRVFKYIIVLALPLLCCYAFADQNSDVASSSNKMLGSKEQGVIISQEDMQNTEDLKSSQKLPLQTAAENNLTSVDKTLLKRSKRTNNNESNEITPKVVEVSPRNDKIIIEVVDKGNDDATSYKTAIAIGIPLIILFVTNIVTLYKIRVESKAAIRNELSMNTINLKKEQLSLFYDPIIALLNTNSEIFRHNG